MPADPLYSTSLSVLLSHLGNIIMENFWSLGQEEEEVTQFLIPPKKLSILSSYFYWLPAAERLGLSGVIVQGLTNLFRQEGAENFPLLGVTGRASREVVTLGGGVSLNANFRVYLLTASPPSQDLIEKIGITLGHISRIILAHIYNPPYWWFAQVNEEEILQRPEVGGVGIAGGYVGGVLRGMPHIVPYNFPS